MSAEGLVHNNAGVALPDGRSAQVSKTSDVDCEFQEDTTTFPDGSTSSILKDFELGKSALILSNQPDVCYIRELTQGQITSHAKRCRAGVVLVKPDMLPSGPKSYVEGGELTADDLSPELAEFCGDRRIVELVVVVTPPSGV
nr:hypothetical protein BaRGS_013604 [Batillaria attramentaria]